MIKVYNMLLQWCQYSLWYEKTSQYFMGADKSPAITAVMATDYDR